MYIFYFRIIYCILGVYYFDDKDEEEVIKTADDYFWFQLCVVVMPNQKTSVKQISDTNSLSYESLQTKVVDEYGNIILFIFEQFNFDRIKAEKKKDHIYYIESDYTFMQLLHITLIILTI